MNITCDLLPDIDHIEIETDDGENFFVRAEDIIDIWFDEISFNAGSSGENERDGRLVLSKNTFMQTSSLKNDGFEETRDEIRLFDRIMQRCDIISVCIVYKSNERLNINVDFDPLENLMQGNIIEYSNCPSAETNENGDLVILFGKSSRSLKRVDNDYYGYIDGFDEYMTKDLYSELALKIQEIQNLCDGVNPENGLFVLSQIRNRGYHHMLLPLLFYDVSFINFDFDFDNTTEVFLNISPTADGRYFVQFDDTCNFFCSRIAVSLNDDDDEEFEEYEETEEIDELDETVEDEEYDEDGGNGSEDIGGEGEEQAEPNEGDSLR